MSKTGEALAVQQGREVQAAGAEIAVTRQASEVQVMAVMAKKEPRNQLAAHTRIMSACARPRLAAGACYEYPKGGTKVTGPSIRLAEAMAQNWGNLDFGIIELEQKDGESSVMAYCWDLETNTRQTKIFTVPHIRYSRNSGNVRLKDPRDIYEMVANQGARRLRACILGIIPGDIQDDAIDECNKTLAGQNTTPLIDRIKKMVGEFKNLGVTQANLKQRLQHDVEECTERELMALVHVFNALNDGAGTKSQYFDVKENASEPKASVGQPTAKAADAKGAPAGGTENSATEKKEPTPQPSAAGGEEAPVEESAEPPSAGLDYEALLAEANRLKEVCPNGPWGRALKAAHIDEAAALEMECAEKLAELIPLVKAGM